MARRWRLVSVTPAGSPKSWMTDPRSGRQVPNPRAGLTEWASAVIETDLEIGRSMAAGAYRKVYIGDELPEGSITDLTTSGVTLIPPDEGAEFTVPIGSGEQIQSRASQRARADAELVASFPYDEQYAEGVGLDERMAIFARWREEQGLDVEEGDRISRLRENLETEKARLAAVREEGLKTWRPPAEQTFLSESDAEEYRKIMGEAADDMTGGAASADGVRSMNEIMNEIMLEESEEGREMREAQDTGVFRPYELYDYEGLE